MTREDWLSDFEDEIVKPRRTSPAARWPARSRCRSTTRRSTRATWRVNTTRRCARRRRQANDQHAEGKHPHQIDRRVLAWLIEIALWSTLALAGLNLVLRCRSWLTFAIHVHESGRLLDRLLLSPVNWHSRPVAVLRIGKKRSLRVAAKAPVQRFGSETAQTTTIGMTLRSTAGSYRHVLADSGRLPCSGFGCRYPWCAPAQTERRKAPSLPKEEIGNRSPTALPKISRAKPTA